MSIAYLNKFIASIPSFTNSFCSILDIEIHLMIGFSRNQRTCTTMFIANYKKKKRDNTDHYEMLNLKNS